MKQFYKWGPILLLLLIIFPTLTARAQTNSESSFSATSVYKGVVSDISSSSLVLTLDNGSFVTIAITSKTLIRISGINSNSPDPTLLFGQRVRVKVEEDADGVLTAVSILPTPGMNPYIQKNGTIVDYVAGKSITIEVNGQKFKYAITSTTKFIPDGSEEDLESAESVTVISSRVISGVGLTAKGILVHIPETTPTPTSSLIVTPKP